MSIKYWSPKKYHMVKIIHLNILLDDNNDIIRPLFVKFPQTTSYINKYKDIKTKITTTTSLMVKDK